MKTNATYSSFNTAAAADCDERSLGLLYPVE